MTPSTLRRCSRCFVLIAFLAVSPLATSGESPMEAMVQAWEANYNSGELAAVQALYTADGCRMPPNAETAHGSEAILAQLEGSRNAAPKVKLDLTNTETFDGNGYATGTYSIMSADGTVLDSGKWMNVNRKVDGSWLIHCDIWNSNRPLPGAE
ncbi:YybH family protein [Elongatibacter sediminis]|uniref:Nuclear transport factor 2 family protein n=1 Tax=Elongatibacter sediminis TaxID=3119006 RepID=A0AAW9R9T3_9GAMM